MNPSLRYTAQQIRPRPTKAETTVKQPRCTHQFTCPSGAILRCLCRTANPHDHIYAHPGIPKETNR